MRNVLLIALVCTVLAACGGKSDGGNEHAGTYSLDKAQFKEMMIAGMKEQMGVEEIPAAQMPMIDGLIEQAAVDIELKADGTWVVTGKMGGDALNEEGTWAVSGTTITFETTMKDGKKASDKKAGTIENGVITVKPDEKMPGEIRLVRK